MNAQGKVGLMLNCPKDCLPKILALLPALASPTVSPLADGRMVAMNTIIDEARARDLIPDLADAGATGIVEFPDHEADLLMLRRLLRIALVIVALVVVTLVGVGVECGALPRRPARPVPGRRVRRGRRRPGPVLGDFGPVTDESTLELEVTPDSPRSVTIWFVVVGGTLYVPSASAEAKTWPGLVANDGRVRVRVGGKIYDLQAARVTDAEIGKLVSEAVTAKYGFGDGSRVEGAWAFELVPRR